MDCLFCKIVKGEVPSEIIYDSESIIAFRDIDPKAPVHVLIIPKKHIAGLNDISAEDIVLLGEMQITAKEIAEKEGINSEGYRLVVNCGVAAGQAVSHLHYHLLGKRQFTWPPG